MRNIMNTQPFDQSFKLLKNSYKFGVAALLSLAFFIASTMPVLASPQVTFNGTGVGPIPDNPNTDPTAPCQTPGPPLNVQFAVSGLTGNVQSLSVSITAEHTYVGDLVARLIPPTGGNGFVLFGYVGSTGTIGNAIFGDGSELGGTYVFSDAAPASPTFWQAAAAVDQDTDIPSGNYRTTTIGGSASGGTVTSLNAAFAGLTPAQANGTWTLRITDGCNQDVGSVSAAALDITTATAPPVAAKPFFDYFGSGKSSFAVYNNTGTNIIWRVLNNGGTGQQETVFWGLSATDYLTPGYFDADNRADIAVWRPSATAGESRFFIRNTNPVSLNVLPFGTANDFPGNSRSHSYTADYDGDGRDDPTTIRRVNGQWLWSYQASSTNTLRSVAFGAQTGQDTDDVPMSGGDFTGDGRADLVVLRQNANGADTYIWGDSVTGQQISSFTWGEFNTDFYVIGDFLGDTRIDFAVWRGAGGGDGNWYIRENGGTGFVARNFGIPGASATRDIAIAGDFGGDSKYDIAVYRPSNNTFYWLESPNFLTFRSQQFGLAGDRPVGELRTY
jgi:subtilisin-like proprotein convertase family protein